MMRPVAPLAVTSGRSAPPPRPTIRSSRCRSNFRSMVDALNLFRDLINDLVGTTFTRYAARPLVQAACGNLQDDGPPRPRPGLLPSILAATEEGETSFEATDCRG